MVAENLTENLVIGVDVHLTLLAVKLYMHGICHAYIRDVVIESCGTMRWLVILSSLHCLVLSLSAAVSGCQRLSAAVSAVSAVSAIRAVRPPASAPAPISDPDPSGHYYHTELALAPATGHPPHPRAPAAYSCTHPHLASLGLSGFHDRYFASTAVLEKHQA